MSVSTNAARWQTATIAAIEPRTPRIKSFFLRTPHPVAHIAGQHVDVRLTADDGYQARRSYSIASAPGVVPIELAIDRLDDGEVSTYFHDTAQPGDAFELLGPIGGHFIWRAAEDGGPLLLVAGGSGIVPLLAMLRERARQRATLPTLLVYSARSWPDMAFGNELLELEMNDPSLRLLFVTTRGPRRRPQDREQRLDAAALVEVLAAWGSTPRHAYLCGATRFVEAMADALVRAGVDAPAIRAERYGGAS
ncbi:MAG TPA: FAD-binding oxidoreductase [Burkholderiaceae bacterium]